MYLHKIVAEQAANGLGWEDIFAYAVTRGLAGAKDKAAIRKYALSLAPITKRYGT
jgi:hypothetical protein